MVSRKAGIVVFVIALGLFGYYQYASASQIGVEVTKSSIIEENEIETKHDVELKFQNPTLLILTAGETEFFVMSNEEMIGKGKLDSFILPSLGDSYVKGIVVTSTNSNSESSWVKITGTTKYDVLLTSIDVPFVYYPTEEQAREFIHQD
ncbi:MAG: hypothetical protein KC483_11070 [Nitrosarchaeum sp.]|nr:hypothetical protein [Nitrosarchaeum sp.]